MTKWSIGLLIVGFSAVASLGCGDSSTSPATSQATPDSTYLASSELPGSVGVGEARESVEDGEQVVLAGRIGGSAKPFVDGIAAFTIVDPKVQSCAAEEGCPTPWDYCCTQNQVKQNIATVKVVDEQGRPVSQDARQLLGVKELNLVLVRGKAERDAEGNLALLANQVYVKE